MQSRAETLHKQLGALPKILENETPGDLTISSVAQLRVEVSDFLSHIVVPVDMEEIGTIAFFQPDNALTFTGISVLNEVGDVIELASARSEKSEHGVTLVGSQIHRGKNESTNMAQQWLIRYTPDLYAEVWYAAEFYRFFTKLQDTAKIAEVEPVLQKLFRSGQELWQAKHR